MVHRFWIAVAIVLVCLLGLAMVVMSFLALRNFAANQLLKQKIAALCEAGEPVSLADLARQPIPAELNAVSYLQQAHAGLTAIENQFRATLNPNEEFDAQQPLRESLQNALRAAFAANPEVLGLLHQAAACPDYDPQIDYSLDSQPFIASLSNQFRGSRLAIQVLEYHALLLLAEGKQEEALQDCLAMLRLARHCDRHPPITIGFLVAVAVRGVAVRSTHRVLRSGDISAASRAALETELTQHHIAESFRQAMRSERALALQRFDELRSGGWHFYDGLSKEECDYIDILEIVIDRADKPYGDASVCLDEVLAAQSLGPLTRLFAPALQATHDVAARIQCELRCLRILNALQQAEVAGTAAEPRLAQLGLPAEEIIDAYTGEPLILKKLPTGWLIYSVGRNQQDDGGKIDNTYTDVGLAPIAEGE